jgi:hypothetical protein
MGAAAARASELGHSHVNLPAVRILLLVLLVFPLPLAAIDPFKNSPQETCAQLEREGWTAPMDHLRTESGRLDCDAVLTNIPDPALKIETISGAAETCPPSERKIHWTFGEVAAYSNRLDR